jgi:phage terminase large subunit
MKPTKIYDKNWEILTQGKTLVVNEGGTRSSKTYSILQIILTLANSPKINNKTFSIVSESLPHLKKGAMKDFFDILNEDKLYNIKNENKTDHIYKIGTNKIEFFGVEESQKLTFTRDFLFINECNNISWESYFQLKMRTNKIVFIDYNPTAEFWVHQNILNNLDNSKAGYIHSTIDDNPYASQETIDFLESIKDIDPNKYRVYRLGLLGSLEGLIFKNFIISSEARDKTKVIYGIDFGFTNDPTTLISVQKVDKTLYIDEIFYEYGLTNEDISNKLEIYGLIKHQDLIYCDSAEPKSIEELYRRGWNVKGAIKGPDSINKGIDKLKQYQMEVGAESLNLIKELRGYSWAKDRDGKYVNRPTGQDHCIDALRYAMSETDKGEIIYVGKMKNY